MGGTRPFQQPKRPKQRSADQPSPAIQLNSDLAHARVCNTRRLLLLLFLHSSPLAIIPRLNPSRLSSDTSKSNNSPFDLQPPTDSNNVSLCVFCSCSRPPEQPIFLSCKCFSHFVNGIVLRHHQSRPRPTYRNRPSVKKPHRRVLVASGSYQGRWALLATQDSANPQGLHEYPLKTTSPDDKHRDSRSSSS